MDSINISDYLTDRNGKNGKCRVCSKAIIWNKQKLGNHKRSGNCIGQSSEERAMFKGLVSSEIHILQSSSRASQAITTSSSPTPAKIPRLVSLLRFESFVLNRFELPMLQVGGFPGVCLHESCFSR